MWIPYYEESSAGAERSLRDDQVCTGNQPGRDGLSAPVHVAAAQQAGGDFMSEVIDIRNTDDFRDVVHRAVHCLSDGELVAFPTDTFYTVAAHALHPEAVSAVCDLDAQTPCVLGLKSADEALDFLPRMSQLARKLTRRCWPGPVTIAFDVDTSNGLLSALPEVTRETLCQQQQLRVRVVSHDVLTEVLRLIPAPLILMGEPDSENAPGRTSSEIVDAWGQRISLVIDDGELGQSQPSTLLGIGQQGWSMVREGVVAQSEVQRLCGDVHLFVCTGNTCRSPMAAAMFRRLLSTKLSCAEQDLVDHGFVVASAGLAAGVGSPASPESIEVLRAQGIDLSGHSSRQLTRELLHQVDHIYTMTRGHRDAILRDSPDLAERVCLLSREGRDIIDPIGMGFEVYKRCQQEIEQNVLGLLNTMIAD